MLPPQPPPPPPLPRPAALPSTGLPAPPPPPPPPPFSTAKPVVPSTGLEPSANVPSAQPALLQTESSSSIEDVKQSRELRPSQDKAEQYFCLSDLGSDVPLFSPVTPKVTSLGVEDEAEPTATQYDSPSESSSAVSMINDTETLAFECELEELPLTDHGNRYRDISERQANAADMSRLLQLSTSSMSRSSASSSLLSPLESELEPFNPFQLISKRSMVQRSERLMDSLRFNAVELSIDLFHMARAELFSNPECFAAIFVPGLVQGEWSLLDRTECVGCIAHIRFVKKFRLPAATVVDREENRLFAVFNRNARPDALIPEKALGYQEFTIEELLEAEQMMLEKVLKAGRRGYATKARAQLALELVHHIGEDRKVLFDFGFLDNAPKRNRMFFVISRALRRGKWSPIYRSEIRLREDVGNFDTAALTIQEFHGGDETKLFRIEVHRAYKNGQTRLLGFMQTSFEKLLGMEPDAQLYWWPAREGITCAKVLVQSVETSHSEYWFSLRLAAQ